MAVGFPAKTNFATGEVLTATNMNDITGTLNLLQSSLFTAGQNKIINGDFNVNQRAFTSTTSSSYGFDRWTLSLSGGTATYSAQTFTAGAAPVAGYEAKNFARVVTTVGNDYCKLDQRIESVRTLAGQTVTVSFWAKGTNPATLGSLNVTMVQSFGTGGSPSAAVIQNFGSFVLTANWTRYTVTGTVPSISGKTIGTANDDNIGFGFGQGANASAEAWTLDIWGVQVEAGSTASPFQTASGSIGGELALCQRYYFRTTPGIAAGLLASGSALTTTDLRFAVKTPVTMRVIPTAIDTSAVATINFADGVNAEITSTGIVLIASTSSQDLVQVYATAASGLTAFRPYYLKANASTTAFIGLTAEL